MLCCLNNTTKQAFYFLEYFVQSQASIITHIQNLTTKSISIKCVIKHPKYYFSTPDNQKYATFGLLNLKKVSHILSPLSSFSSCYKLQWLLWAMVVSMVVSILVVVAMGFNGLCSPLASLLTHFSYHGSWIMGAGAKGGGALTPLNYQNFL